MGDPIDNSVWYQETPDQALQKQGVSFDSGLPPEEAAERLRKYGPNELTEGKARSPARIFAEQFSSTIVVVLVVAAAVSGFMGNFKDAVAIMAIVILNAVLGLIQEYRAEQAMAALRKMSTPTVRVRRGGESVEIDAGEVVPGDLLSLETGNLVPADGRVVAEANLRVQESALTGESEAVEKDVDALAAEEVPLGDRNNMVFRGTWVTYGRGTVLVTSTGMSTELGRIATLLQSVEREPTPLQRRLGELGRTLVILSLVVAALIFLLGYLRGESLDVLFMTAVSIAVAAIPEGLPAVVTIALALGAQRMLKRKALIRKLPAVETLGSVTVICSDKTGTLTENRMTVTVLDIASHRIDLSEHLHKTTGVIDTDTPELKPVGEAAALKLLLAGGALCNDAELQKRKTAADHFHAVGEPTESALIVAAARLGYSKGELAKQAPRLEEKPFDSERKRMSTLHRLDASGELAGILREVLGSEPAAVVLAKGAVESLLEVCTRVVSERGVENLDAQWQERISRAHDDLAGQGVRVLGFACRPVADPQATGELEQELIFVGFFGIIDPPRPEVRDAIATCRAAGIRPVMITGDHPSTARSIAEDLNIAKEAKSVEGRELERMSADELIAKVEDTSVFARVSPEHKLRIVSALQKKGHVVAMTGDGVNDAPALRRADIGVAMGITGTDVSREAAHMVLLDDNFTTIVAAVEEGRTIFDNIRKFVKYSVAGNLGKILVVLVAPLLLMPLPLTPLQILWLNLLTDGLLGLGLSVEPSEPGVMDRKPIAKSAPFFSAGMLRQIALVGFLVGGVSLAVGYLGWRLQDAAWQTAIFTTIAVAQVWQALAVRTNVQSLFRVGLFSNRALFGAVVAVLLLQGAVVYLPFLQGIFETEPLSLAQLGSAVVAGSLVFWVLELRKWLVRRKPGIGVT